MGGWEPDQNPSVHSSYIDHPFFWKFCIPIILLLLLQLYFHASLLFWKPENEFSNSFSQWKALALGNGRKKELMCPVLWLLDAPPTILGPSAIPAQAMCFQHWQAEGGCHPWSTELLGPAAVLVAKLYQGLWFWWKQHQWVPLRFPTMIA